MTGRTYHPTATDLAAWRKLIRKARVMAANPTAPLGDLLAAAKAAAPRPVPSDEALTRFASPLVRLAQAWPAMDDAARKANADRLSWLAEGLGPLVGATADQVFSGPIGGGMTSTPVRRALDAIAAAPLTGQDRLRFQALADEGEGPRPEPAPRRDIFG